MTEIISPDEYVAMQHEANNLLRMAHDHAWSPDENMRIASREMATMASELMASAEIRHKYTILALQAQD